MKSTIDNSRLPDYLRVVNNGALSHKGFDLMWASVLASGHWRPGIPILMDHRDIKTADADGQASESLFHAMTIFECFADRIPGGCVAILMDWRRNYLATRRLQYGLAVKNLKADIQVFFFEDEAVKWIESIVGEPA